MDSQRQFDKELTELKKKLIHMAATAETMIDRAIRELVSRDQNLATVIPDYEQDLNRLQIEIDEMVLTLVAILWGTLSIMLLLAFGEGLKRQFEINDKGLGEGIVILWGGQTSMPFQGFGKGRRIHLRPDDVDYLRRRMPEMVGRRGSSQPVTSFSFTSCRSLRLLITV